MEEFIKMAAGKLGASEESIKSATGGLLGMIKGQVPGGDFEALLGKLPGARDLVSGAASGAGKTADSGGMLGGLMQKAGSALGGSVGSSAGLMGILGKSGLDVGQAGNFVTMFTDFVKNKAGADMVGTIMAKLPELKKFTG